MLLSKMRLRRQKLRPRQRKQSEYAQRQVLHHLHQRLIHTLPLWTMACMLAAWAAVFRCLLSLPRSMPTLLQ